MKKHTLILYLLVLDGLDYICEVGWKKGDCMSCDLAISLVSFSKYLLLALREPLNGISFLEPSYLKKMR